MANDRLRALEEVENQIATILQCAGNIVLELSKDKHNASFLDRQLSQFTGSVSRVETELSSQIKYLTQVGQRRDRHVRPCTLPHWELKHRNVTCQCRYDSHYVTTLQPIGFSKYSSTIGFFLHQSYAYFTFT
uniref:Mediator of RNA polymerase II transcription subunit 11 n=1 Tax=Hucho hucho TaxID=62062 RepID=A0A4W5MDS3_9TELE